MFVVVRSGGGGDSLLVIDFHELSFGTCYFWCVTRRHEVGQGEGVRLSGRVVGSDGCGRMVGVDGGGSMVEVSCGMCGITLTVVVGTVADGVYLIQLVIVGPEEGVTSRHYLVGVRNLDELSSHASRDSGSHRARPLWLGVDAMVAVTMGIVVAMTMIVLMVVTKVVGGLIGGPAHTYHCQNNL